MWGQCLSTWNLVLVFLDLMRLVLHAMNKAFLMVLAGKSCSCRRLNNMELMRLVEEKRLEQVFLYR